jgi:two-component system response regulator FixJ
LNEPHANKMANDANLISTRNRSAVYVVDDDVAVLNALKFSLGIDGYDVSTFTSGTEFLKVADHVDDGCLVVDYHLPDINGMDLAQLMRARGMKSPVILITSQPGPAVLRRAFDAGFRVIEKPLMDATLRNAIRSMGS